MDQPKERPETEVPEDGREDIDAEEFEAFQQYVEDYTHPDRR